MNKLAIIPFFVFVLVSFSFASLDCNSVKYYVENVTYGANSGKIDFSTAIESLSNSMNAYKCTNKGVLILEGSAEYSYKINGTSVGSFVKKIFLRPEGSYSIVASNGSLTQTKNVTLDAGKIIILHFDIKPQQKKPSSGGSGPIENTFYTLDKDSILDYLNNIHDELNLSNKDVEYQKMVYNDFKFNVKYIRYKFGDANSLYYYFTNKDDRVANITLILVIPKSISKNLNGVAISTGYKIIRNDPIVAWDYKVKPGSTVKVGYTVEKNITSVLPIVVLFHNIDIKQSKTPIGSVQNNTTNQTEPNNTNNTTENVTKNETGNLVITPPKREIPLWPFFVAGVAAVIVGLYILLYKRGRHYDELERALSTLESFSKNRRR